MKTVSIFIAGSTKLSEEMTRIKAIISDLDYRYGSRGYRIKISTFANHGDSQTTYNDYIRDEADIVLFILNGSIGAVTEEEYMIAMDSLTAKGRPEVYVFVNATDEDSPEYQHILSVIRRKLLDEKKYYIKYRNNEDLGYLVRSRLDEYLLKREKNPRRSRFIGWMAAAAIAIASLCILISRERCEIVFAGGGSVANYLKSIDLDVNKDVSLFRRSIYSRLPSGAAWTLLSEDVNLYMLNQNESTVVHRDFFPVCLSAGKIDLNIFGSVADKESKKQSAIIECYLGEDPLVVYTKEALIDKLINEGRLLTEDLSDDCLTSDGLDSLLSACDGKTATAFATNIESGTRKMYFKSLIGKDASGLDSAAAHSLVYSDLVRLYNESSPADLIYENDGDRFVILGSEFYTVNAIDMNATDKDGKPVYRKLKVQDAEGKVISKSMFLYFVLYKAGNSDKYQVPGSFMPILRKLNKAGKIDPGCWNEIQSGRIAWKDTDDSDTDGTDKRRVIEIGLKQ